MSVWPRDGMRQHLRGYSGPACAALIAQVGNGIDLYVVQTKGLPQPLCLWGVGHWRSCVSAVAAVYVMVVDLLAGYHAKDFVYLCPGWWPRAVRAARLGSFGPLFFSCFSYAFLFPLFFLCAANVSHFSFSSLFFLICLFFLHFRIFHFSYSFLIFLVFSTFLIFVLMFTSSSYMFPIFIFLFFVCVLTVILRFLICLLFFIFLICFS